MTVARRRPSPVAIAAAALGVVIVFLVIVFAVRVLAPPSEMPAITSIDYRQAKPVPNFDGSTSTTRDPVRIADFRAVVKKYSIDVETFDGSALDGTGNDVCTGGLTTDITIHFEDSTERKLHLYDCSTPVPKGTFVTDATALFTGWRAADGK